MRISDWSSDVCSSDLRDLSLGLSRYDAFRASTGIPAATLASRLRHLTDHGIVERVRYQERPARDAYRLTEKGRDLWRVSMALREWGDRWDAADRKSTRLNSSP